MDVKLRLVEQEEPVQSLMPRSKHLGMRFPAETVIAYIITTFCLVFVRFGLPLLFFSAVRVQYIIFLEASRSR